MRGSRSKLLGTDVFEKSAQGLLRDVIRRKHTLMLGNAAYCAMEHRQKGENQETCGGLPVEVMGSEEGAEEFIGARVGLGRF
jgi:hypothetical protein